MIESDTIKLLRECDSGIKMGVKSINDVLSHVKSEKLRERLIRCCDEHDKLQDETVELLHRYGDAGRDPSPMVKGMASMKTGMKLAMEESDHTVADLMTDGCNMGVKSLSRYLNQYKAADEVSKDIAKRLISLESQLAEDIRDYL